MIDYYEPNIDLTLLGCGFIGPYHIGAICLLSQVWPHKPYNRLCGSSCGGLIGSLIVGGSSLETAICSWADIVRHLRVFLKNPIEIVSINGVLERVLEKRLPLNAHKNCSGRLGLSLTKCSTFRNEFVCEFSSRKELIEALVCGCFIPLWSGTLTTPTYRGQKYIDGCYSDNKPKFDITPEQELAGVRHLEISAFSCDIQISPKDEHWLVSVPIFGTTVHFNWTNICVRARHALFPHEPSNYTGYLIDGHRHMKEFILKSDLVKCFECYQSQVGAQKQQQHTVISRDPCLRCLKLFEKIDSLEVPQDFFKRMRDPNITQ